MKKYPKVSIIIPLYVISERFFKDLRHYERLDYPNFELIIVADRKVEIPRLKGVKTTLLLTGKRRTGPAEKRDVGISKATGKICAFIDDDAYPHKSWLKQGVLSLYEENVVAVGGPGVTPKEDGFWEQAGGLVYESRLTSGKAQNRFSPRGGMVYVQDWPAYNLMVWKKALDEVGGYGSDFYGGEDTFLCLKLIKKGKKIKYNPKTIVYHHRRPLFLPHLRQILNVGIHRGYFAKRFPQTSRKFLYFIPSILTVGFIVLLVGSFFSHLFASIFTISFLFSIIAAILSVIHRAGFFKALIVAIGIILTHLTYGIGFILGLLTPELRR